MPALARVIPWLVLVFALLALALGLFEWSNPPFTDEQLRASTVDTWEVAASTTRVFAFVLLGLGVICVVLARKVNSGRARVVALLAAAACTLALLVFLRNHIDLAQRTTAATGREVGPGFGLL